MHRPLNLLFSAALLLAPSGLFAQERYHLPDPNLMARLSYDNSGAVQNGNVRHVCIAVSRDGEYRIVQSLDHGQSQRLHGTMSREEFDQLSKLLESAQLRKLFGDHGGLVRQQAERFAAEVPLRDRSHVDESPEGLEQKAWHLQWLNGDGENPFPASVSNVVEWIKRFEPTDGKSFEYTEYPDVCPAGGLRLLQPSVAENSILKPRRFFLFSLESAPTEAARPLRFFKGWGASYDFAYFNHFSTSGSVARFP